MFPKHLVNQDPPNFSFGTGLGHVDDQGEGRRTLREQGLSTHETGLKKKAKGQIYSEIDVPVGNGEILLKKKDRGTRTVKSYCDRRL